MLSPGTIRSRTHKEYKVMSKKNIKCGEVGMKGYIDSSGHDRPACDTCKYKGKPTIYCACYNCISVTDLALRKPNYKTEFVNYEPDGKDRG